MDNTSAPSGLERHVRKPISWDEKAALFRAYRRLGHLKPAAERCRVARMTARKILKELESMGFSLRPRLSSLGEEDFRELQETHLSEVALQLRENGLLTPPGPRECVFGDVDENELMERKFPESRPLDDVLGTAVAWHIKTLSVARSAASHVEEDVAYRRACLTLCYRLMDAVEEATGLPVRPEQSPHPGSMKRSWESGWIWLLQVIAPLYRSFFGGRRLEPANWKVEAGGSESGPEWKVLRQGVGSILIEGPAQSLGRVEAGLKKLVTSQLGDLAREAQALELRWQDLKTLTELVRGKLHHTPDLGGIPGICPACPFPEKDELPAARRRRRRGRQAGSQQRSKPAG